MASPALQTILATLATNDVELIVVGLLAAVAQGAPVATHDVDIVHRRTPENVARLVDVLVNQLDARCPPIEIVSGPGHSLLETKFGPLDVLGAIEGGRDYDALLPRSHRIELQGRPLHVLDLEMIIELKRGSTRPKDQLVLPILEETLRIRQGR